MLTININGLTSQVPRLVDLQCVERIENTRASRSPSNRAAGLGLSPQEFFRGHTLVCVVSVARFSMNSSTADSLLLRAAWCSGVRPYNGSRSRLNSIADTTRVCILIVTLFGLVCVASYNLTSCKASTSRQYSSGR